MPEQSYLDEFWRRHDNFKFEIVAQAGAEEDVCLFAQQFKAWFQRTCQAAIDEPDLIAINQAKLRLIDHYFDLRSYVPRSHRNRMGERGHSCIFHIFERGYAALRLAEFNLAKPSIFLPDKPALLPVPPPPTFGDVFVDEVIE